MNSLFFALQNTKSEDMSSLLFIVNPWPFANPPLFKALINACGFSPNELKDLLVANTIPPSAPAPSKAGPLSNNKFTSGNNQP